MKSVQPDFNEISSTMVAFAAHFRSQPNECALLTKFQCNAF